MSGTNRLIVEYKLRITFFKQCKLLLPKADQMILSIYTSQKSRRVINFFFHLVWSSNLKGKNNNKKTMKWPILNEPVLSNIKQNIENKFS